MLQFIRLCEKYDINFIYPTDLTYDSHWLSGFIDADGTITINHSNNQLSISLSQKNIYLLQIIQKLYGGSIYKDNSKYESFKLYYTSKNEQSQLLLNYFKFAPLRTAKLHRISLIKQFYYLKTLPQSELTSKAWVEFYKKWTNYEG